MTLAEVKEQDGMVLAKVKEQDGMMLAKVKYVKVPSIPTSAACCDGVQLTNAESSSYTFYNRQLLNRTVSSKPQIPLVTVPFTSKWTNTRARLAGNPGIILSCPRNRVSLTTGRCEYRVHHALVRIRASTVYARASHTTTT